MAAAALQAAARDSLCDHVIFCALDVTGADGHDLGQHANAALLSSQLLDSALEVCEALDRQRTSIKNNSLIAHKALME